MEFTTHADILSDDFFPLMDMNEDVDLFDIKDHSWTTDEVQSSKITSVGEEQFQSEADMNPPHVGVDINPLDLVVLQENASSDVESIISVEDNESPQKLMKMSDPMSSPSVQQPISSHKKEAFDAKKRLEELRKLPVVERQREARKRHRLNQAQFQQNKMAQDSEVTGGVAASSSDSAIKGDKDDVSFLSQNEAELIVRTTGNNLKALGIDPDSKEGKKQGRKIRNRMSAQLHRERKKEYIDTLEAKIKDRDEIINQLQSQINALMSENEELKKQLNPSPCEFPVPSTSDISAETSSASVSDSDTDDVSVSVNEGDGSSIPSSSVSNMSTLFSVFIMFGMTFWSAPAPINGGRKLTVVDPATPEFSNPIQVSHLSLPYPQEKYHASGNNEVSIFHSRRRLSFATSDSIDEDNDGEEVDSISFKTGPLVPLSNTNVNPIDKNIMWSYDNDDKIVQLYPLQISRRPILQTGKPTLETPSRPSSNHLRKRVLTGNDSSNAASPADTGNSGRFNKKMYTNTAPSALSRIVVTSGKALLDPRMTTNRRDDIEKPVHKDDDHSRSIVPIFGHRGSASSSYVINHMREDDGNVDPKTRQVALKETFGSEGGNGDPMLMMLLPASVVQWGTRWSNDNNNFQDFMKNHNINSSTFGERENGGDTGEMSDYFIEIGCSVFKAHLVKNVTIM